MMIGGEWPGGWRRAQLRAHLTQLFGGLDDDVADRIADCVEWITVPAGDAVFEQDDDPDGAYVVLSGRLRILRIDRDGAMVTIGQVGRGELLGEMALLDGGTRLGRPLAVRDTELAWLPRVVFDDLMGQHLPAMMGVARTILRRVRDRADVNAGEPPSTVVALVGAAPDVRLGTLASELRDSVARWGAVCHATSSHVASLLGRDETLSQPHADTMHPRLGQWLHEVENAHHVVLLEVDPGWTPWTRWATGQADHVIVVAWAGGDPRPGEVERRLEETAAERRPRKTLVLIHHAAIERPHHTRAWLDSRAVDVHLHRRTGVRQDIDRLARHVTGRAVGVALGGGGARGFAHIGVLRASVSIPGVMPPVAIGDELHVDGGVLDNLPVRAVRAYPGVGTVIAVDVAPHAGPRVTRDHGMHLSGWHLLRDRLLPGRTPPRVPGIMSTVLRSMLVAAERERSEVIDGGLADLFLQLQVPDLGLLDFDQVGPTAEAGYAQALPELERWLARSEQSHIVRAAVGLG